MIKISHLIGFIFLLSISCNTPEPRKLLSNDVSEEEAWAFGEKILDETFNGTTNFIESQISLEELLYRGVENKKIRNQILKEKYKTELEEGIYNNLYYTTEFRRMHNNGGDIDIIKNYTDKEGIRRLVLRHYDESGTGFMEFLIQKDSKENKLVIVDVYSIAMAENLSKTLGEAYADMFQAGGMFDQKLDVKDEGLIEVGLKMAEISTLIMDGNNEKAYEIFQEIPEKHRKRKSVQVINLRITSGLMNDSIYMDAIEEYESLFPNDPSLDLLSIDGYYLMKDYKNALIRVNNLIDRYSEDFSLYFMKGNTYYLMDDLEKSVSNFEQCLAMNPEFEDACDALFTTYFEMNEYDKSLKYASQLINNFDYLVEDIETYIQGENPSFLSSEIYKNWANKMNSMAEEL